MKKYLLAGAALMVMSGLPLAAHADTMQGYTNSSAELLAGPGSDFPAVAHVASGVNIDIMGCVNGFTWCDVSWNGNRGWIDANYLDSIYKDRHVKVTEYGSQEKLPVVVFEQKSYWDNYYRDQPFYTEHRYWTTNP